MNHFFDLFIIRYFSSKQLCSFLSFFLSFFLCLFITYLAYYCTEGQYPGIYYVLFVTFIIYIIIVVFIDTIIITIIIIIIIVIVIVIYTFLLFIFIPPQSHFQLLLTYYCYFNCLLAFIISIDLQLYGNCLSFLNIVSIILEHCFLFTY